MAKKRVIEVDASQALNELEKVEQAAKKTSDNLKENKEQTADFGKTLNELKDSFSLSTIATKGLSQGLSVLKTGFMAVIKQMWLMVSNPIGAILATIAIAATTLYNVFKNFQPIVDKVEQSMAALSAVVSVVKNLFIGLFTGTKSLSESFKNLGGTMSQAAKDAIELKKAEQDLEDQQKIMEVQNKKLEAQYNQLILQSKNRTLSEKERLALLEQASKIEEQIYNNNKQLADEEYENALSNLKKKGSLKTDEIKMLREKGVEYALDLQNRGDISDEDIDRLKNAELKKIDILNQSTNLQEKNQNRIDQLNQTASDKAEKAKEEAKKRLEEEVKAEQDARQKQLEARQKLYDFNKKLKDKEKADEEKRQQKFASDLDKETKRQEDAQAFRQKDYEIWLNDRITNENNNYKDRIAALDQFIADTRKKEKDKEIGAEEAAIIIRKAEEDQIKIKQEAEAKKFDFARNTINKIQEIDQLATQTAINLQAQKLKSGKITQEEYDKNVAKIQEKAAKREKMYALGQAIINTAQAVSKALTSSPPPLNFILAAAVGAFGALQIAKIASQPIAAASASGGSTSTPSTSAGTGTAPATSFTFAPVATSPQTEPVKAFVIGKDVNTQQQLDRQIIANGTI